MAVVSKDPAQVDGLSTPEDLAAAGDYDQPMGTKGAPHALVVCIEIKPNGEITVYDKAGMVDPLPAENLDDALASAGELANELSQRMAATAMKEREMMRPGAQDAKAMWDEMAAQRESRGNT